MWCSWDFVFFFLLLLLFLFVVILFWWDLVLVGTYRKHHPKMIWKQGKVFIICFVVQNCAFFLQVSQEFISTLFSCFSCFWIWNKEKKSNFWILCFSLFKRFLWFESWKKNGVSYDEWGLQGSLSPGSSSEGLGRLCGRFQVPMGMKIYLSKNKEKKRKNKWGLEGKLLRFVLGFLPFMFRIPIQKKCSKWS